MADEKFHLVSNYAPTGDQPQAIEPVSYTHLTLPTSLRV